jgi:release factor glutamine methyltransferase
MPCAGKPQQTASGHHNVTVLQSTGSARCRAAFAMIVSNPPYIDEHDPHLAQGDVRLSR